MSRWGLTLPLPMTSIADQVDLVKRAEAAGYTDVWSGETAGPDGFTPLAFAAAHATQVRVGTGVVGVFQRGPALLAQQAASMADATGGRFVLGIGASSDRIVEGWNGIPFEKPYSKVEGDARLPGRGAQGRSHAERLQARVEAPARDPGRPGRAPRPDAQARRRAGERRVLELPADLGPSPGRRGHRGRARAGSSSCAASSAFPASARRSSRSPGSCSPPTSRSRSTRRSTAGSGHGGRDRPDGRGVEGQGPPEGRRRGAVGADRRDVHPWRARRDARAPRALHRGRDHPARPHADHDARTSWAT